MKLVLTRKQCSELYDMLSVLNAPKEHLQLFDVQSPAAVVDVPDEFREVTLIAMLNVALYLADRISGELEYLNLKLEAIKKEKP